MSIRNTISIFFKKHTDSADRTLFLLMLLNLLFGSVFTLINTMYFHYPQPMLFNLPIKNEIFSLDGFFLKALAPSLLFFLYGIYIRTESPRASTFLWGIGFLPLCFFTNMVIAYGIQPTPFTPIDSFLVKVDRALGIDTPTLMAWTHNHPAIHHFLTIAYQSLILELFGLILIFTTLSARKPLTTFYLAQLSTILVGTLIYYFFPTTAPSGIFHSPYFTGAEKDTSLRFYELHHHLTITTMST